MQAAEWFSGVELHLLGGVGQLQPLRDLAAAEGAQESIKALALDVLQGRFDDVLTSVECAPLVAAVTSLATAEEAAASDVEKATADLLDGADELTQQKALLLGVAALDLFVQANWTGPSVESVPLVCDQAASALQEACLTHLCADGEDFYRHSQFAVLLCLAKGLLRASALPACSSRSWWELRAVTTHMKLMHSQSSTLKAQCDAAVAAVEQSFGQLPAEPSTLQRKVCAKACVEAARYHHKFWHYRFAKEWLDKAQAATGQQSTVTGVMGMRTKYQREKKSQLVVLASSELAARADDTLLIEASLPERDLYPTDCQLEEDNALLSHMKLDLEAQEHPDEPLRCVCVFSSLSNFSVFKQ